jgi:hypothetical protein
MRRRRTREGRLSSRLDEGDDKKRKKRASGNPQLRIDGSSRKVKYRELTLGAFDHFFSHFR